MSENITPRPLERRVRLAGSDTMPGVLGLRLMVIKMKILFCANEKCDLFFYVDKKHLRRSVPKIKTELLDNGMELKRIMHIHTNKLIEKYTGKIAYFCDDCFNEMKKDGRISKAPNFVLDIKNDA